jgi:hypothetical protein
MAELDKWDSFYVIVGSAGGALIGLQFVVMTLIAERPTRHATIAGRAFGTPTVVHFSAVLLIAALLRAPWGTAEGPAAVCGLVGAAGVLYALITARRMHVQTAYTPDFEDWLCHAELPLLAYAILIASACAMLLSEAAWAPFGIGGATLLLLFCGIHNAWDAVAFQVITRTPRDTSDG